MPCAVLRGVPFASLVVEANLFPNAIHHVIQCDELQSRRQMTMVFSVLCHIGERRIVQFLGSSIWHFFLREPCRFLEEATLCAYLLICITRVCCLPLVWQGLVMEVVRRIRHTLKFSPSHLQASPRPNLLTNFNCDFVRAYR